MMKTLEVNLTQQCTFEFFLFTLAYTIAEGSSLGQS